MSGPAALPTSFAAVQPLNVAGGNTVTNLAQGGEGDALDALNALVAPAAGGVAAQGDVKSDDEKRPLSSGAVKIQVNLIGGGVKLPNAVDAVTPAKNGR